jgi:type-F conjugative transfer system pilin assembly protein TrbC
LAETRTALIDTPTFCHRVSRVEGNRVYLLSGDPRCMPGPGKASVELDSGVTEVEVYVDGKPWSTQPVVGYGVQGVDDLARRAVERSEGVELPPNPNAPRGQREAEELSAKFFAPEHQLRIHAEQEPVRNALLPPGTMESLARQAPNPLLADSERLYVFVSHSIPLETLRTYAEAIHKAGDPNVVMVLRGMVGGMKYFRPTAEFVQSIVLTDPDCPASGKTQCDAYATSVLIDPLLFRRYAVTRVPTFVYARDVRLPAGPSGSEGIPEKASVGAQFALAGDVSLDYAVEALNREAKSPSLTALVGALRKGFHN